MQVSIRQVCNELVSCVLSLGRECEGTIEEEIEVRVVTYDASVESF